MIKQHYLIYRWYPKGQSWLASKGNEAVLHILQSSWIGALSSHCILLNPGNSLGMVLTDYWGAAGVFYNSGASNFILVYQRSPPNCVWVVTNTTNESELICSFYSPEPTPFNKFWTLMFRIDWKGLFSWNTSGKKARRIFSQLLCKVKSMYNFFIIIRWLSAGTASLNMQLVMNSQKLLMAISWGFSLNLIRFINASTRN